MPHDRIHIATSDGSRVSYDLVGPALDRIGAVRALVTETLIEAGRERPEPGGVRTVTVEADDEHGYVVVRASVTVRGRPVPRPEDQAVWGAMAAITRVQGGRSGRRGLFHIEVRTSTAA